MEWWDSSKEEIKSEGTSQDVAVVNKQSWEPTLEAGFGEWEAEFCSLHANTVSTAAVPQNGGAAEMEIKHQIKKDVFLFLTKTQS